MMNQQRYLLRAYFAAAACLCAWAQHPDHYQTLSPDGKKLAFVTEKPSSPPGNVEAEISVRTLNQETGMWGPAVVIASEGTNFAPQWSPDSTRLVFYGERGSSGDIYVINADGTGERNLTANYDGGDTGAIWSPDGSRIAFFSDRPDGKFSSFRVWVMKADGSGLVGTTGWFWPVRGLRWWGTERLLAYDGDANAEYLFNADGSGEPTLVYIPDASPPWINPDGIVLGTLTPQQASVSPLALVSLFGSRFSFGESLSAGLSESGGVATIGERACVRVGNIRAPILAVTPVQINLQVPKETPYGPVAVAAINNCGMDGLEQEGPPVMVTVEEATPGLFLYPPYGEGGYVAARFNEDGAPVAPAGQIVDGDGRISRPAKPGDIIELYGTGWGRTTVELGTGELSVAAVPLLLEANPKVLFSGILVAPENILYVGVAPNFAGLYQLNLMVPQTTLPGDHGIVLTVYGKSSPEGPVIPVSAP